MTGTEFIIDGDGAFIIDGDGAFRLLAKSFFVLVVSQTCWKKSQTRHIGWVTNRIRSSHATHEETTA